MIEDGSDVTDERESEDGRGEAEYDLRTGEEVFSRSDAEG